MGSVSHGLAPKTCSAVSTAFGSEVAAVAGLAVVVVLVAGAVELALAVALAAAAMAADRALALAAPAAAKPPESTEWKSAAASTPLALADAALAGTGDVWAPDATACVGLDGAVFAGTVTGLNEWS